MEPDDRAQDLKGRTKEAAGALTGDDELKAEGRSDQAAASVKDTLRKVKNTLDDAVDRASDSSERR